MKTPAVALLLTVAFATPAVTPVSGRDAEHAAAQAAAKAGLQLEPGVRIPFDLRGNLVFLRGRINDSDSLWMVLDSGAQGNVIDAAVAGTIGLESSRTVESRGAGGAVRAGWVNDATVRLPGATLTGVSAATTPLDAFRRQSGRPMEAIIGHPLISRCVVRVDYAARELELLPATGYHYRGSGKAVPITYVDGAADRWQQPPPFFAHL